MVYPRQKGGLTMSEVKCDCDACRFNEEQDKRRKEAFAKLQNEFEEAMLKMANRKPITKEDIELAKGKAIVIGQKLAEDIWADQHVVRFVRLNQMERLLYSGQARMATSREKSALM
jgi:hypothetical protein